MRNSGLSLVERRSRILVPGRDFGIWDIIACAKCFRPNLEGLQRIDEELHVSDWELNIKLDPTGNGYDAHGADCLGSDWVDTIESHIQCWECGESISEVLVDVLIEWENYPLTRESVNVKDVYTLLAQHSYLS